MSTGMKGEIERLYNEGYRDTGIVRLTGATASYVNYVLGLHRNGGPTAAMLRESHEAADRKHLRLIAADSDGKGFPYCVRRG